MNFKKSTALLTLTVLGCSTVAPPIVLAAEVNQNALPASSQTTEPSENMKTTDPSALSSSSGDNSSSTTSPAPIVSAPNDLSAIVAEDVNIYVGDSWKPEDNFVGFFDSSGNQSNILSSAVIVDSSQVDTTKPGDYPVVYSYTDNVTLKTVTKTVLVHVKANQTAVNVHNSTVYVGDTWIPQSNFDSALDKSGNPVDFSKIAFDSSKLDTAKAGTYDITYTYGNVTSTAKVTVTANQTAVNVHNSTVYVGDTWTPQSNFDSALDKNGNPVDFSKITVDDSKLDITKAGTYDITYTYGNVTSTAKVTVTANQTAVNVHNSTVYVGDTWTPQSNFDSALDKNGNPVDFSKITVDDSKLDITKAGTYDITYTYGNVTSTAKVTVTANQTAVNVHNSTVYVGDTWTSQSNFDSALDKNGNPVDFSKITVDDSKLDITKAGTYDITYTYGNVTSTAKVTVTANQTAVNVHNSTVYVGDTWTPQSNFDSALDKNGNPVDFSKITVDDSKLDITKAGTYDITYTYGNVTSTAKVTVTANQTAVNVHNSTVYVGDTWTSQSNFDSALDKNGNPVDFSKITVDDSKLDITKAGTYDITYTYGNVTSTAKVTVTANQTAVNVHNSTVYVGDTWTPQSNFDSALDKNGNPVDFSKITVDDSKLDITKAGTYDITYTYGNVTSTAKVTVTANQTAVNVHNSTVYVGDTWTSQSNFDSALDKNGNPVDFSKITVDDSKLDITKAGTYDITYTYGNVTSTAKVTVTANQTAVNVHNSTVYVGDTWTPQSNFDSALDKNGNPVDFSKITVDDSKLDITKAGTYDITYTYGNVTSTAKVTVTANQTAVNVHNSTVYVGDTWTPQSNFDSALDKNGNPVDFSKITVDDSKLDITKAGTYDITYTYGNVTSTAKVTVTANQTAVNVHNSTVYVGDTWTSQSNFDSALDKNGNPVDFSKITVDDSKLDITKAGTYDITYTYGNVTSTAKVTINDLSAIDAKDVNIYVGDSWKPEDNFVSVSDSSGNESTILSSAVIVDSSQVDTTKPGDYPVVYSYTDNVTLKTVTKTVLVHVKANQTAVNVHNSTVYVGDTWTPQSNFDSALDKNGNPVDFSKITVDDSKLDITKAGTYDITYTYGNVTSTAKVTVTANQTAVNVHNSTVYVGDTWTPQSNFDSALDKNGNPVDFSKITVDDSKLDITKAGTYDITYTYGNVTSTAKVTINDLSAIDAKDVNIYVGDSWKPEDNFISVSDSSGNESTILSSAVIVDSSQVDTTKPGDYPVVYSYTDNVTLRTVTKTVLVHVKANQTAVNVHNSTVYVGDTWTPQSNFDSALDKNGNPVDFSKITVDDSKLDITKAGTYDITYTYGNVTSTAKVTVKDKVPTEPGNPNISGKPTIPVVPSGSAHSNGSGNKTIDVSNSEDKKKDWNYSLPETDENKSMSLIVSTFGLLLTLIGFTLFNKRKQRREK